MAMDSLRIYAMNVNQDGQVMVDLNKRGRPRADVLNSLPSVQSTAGILCKYCHRTFPRDKSLQAHMRTHTGERPYKCDYPDCTRAFVQSGQLKTHQRLHTGEKPFYCPELGCASRFTHANRKCPQHPGNILKRDQNGLLHLDKNSVQNSQVLEWLKRQSEKGLKRNKAKRSIVGDLENVTEVKAKLSSTPMVVTVVSLDQPINSVKEEPKAKSQSPTFVPSTTRTFTIANSEVKEISQIFPNISLPLKTSVIQNSPSRVSCSPGGPTLMSPPSYSKPLKSLPLGSPPCIPFYSSETFMSPPPGMHPWKQLLLSTPPTSSDPRMLYGCTTPDAAFLGNTCPTPDTPSFLSNPLHMHQAMNMLRTPPPTGPDLLSTPKFTTLDNCPILPEEEVGLKTPKREMPSPSLAHSSSKKGRIMRCLAEAALCSPRQELLSPPFQTFTIQPPVFTPDASAEDCITPQMSHNQSPAPSSCGSSAQRRTPLKKRLLRSSGQQSATVRRLVIDQNPSNGMDDLDLGFSKLPDEDKKSEEKTWLSALALVELANNQNKKKQQF